MAETPTANPGAAKVHPFRDIRDRLLNVTPKAVFVLVAASMGLGLVGAQVQTFWVLVLFAIFWGITVVAMLVLAARMITEHESTTGGGRHRAVH
ncbi:hypothetical protein C7C46_04715 [Streptomyces tateyamensis]|uniref:Uncharacterized protein n=1 Tax=Streptomyces tateyamensis TaxID=565073 RepID=A0A2V4NLU3_9ACTN|nr:hypothetical protein [Streptomyces tateyamensis]PYC87386.1 hypothetical protein C7C46_04715 [Streptomyces tateyamensis]